MLIKNALASLLTLLFLTACAAEADRIVVSTVPPSLSTIQVEPTATPTLEPTASVVPAATVTLAATATPTATAVAVATTIAVSLQDPTASPEAKQEPATVIQFDSLESSPFIPDNILKEIAYFNEGGGGRDEDACLNVDGLQLINTSVFEVKSEYEINEQIIFAVCPGAGNENIRFTLQNAGGKAVLSTEQERVIDPFNDGSIAYPTEIRHTFSQETEGNYILIVNNGSEEITHNFTVIQARFPYVENTALGIQLRNFLPQETIYLVTYGLCPQMIVFTRCPQSSVQFQVDQDGAALIDKINSRGFTFGPDGEPEFTTIIYAETSNYVVPLAQNIANTPQWSGVALEKTSIFDGPYLDAPVKQTVQKDEVVQILGEAMADGQSGEGLVRLAHVRLADGTEGWGIRELFAKID